MLIDFCKLMLIANSKRNGHKYRYINLKSSKKSIIINNISINAKSLILEDNKSLN
jgi:hypothetical protein